MSARGRRTLLLLALASAGAWTVATLVALTLGLEDSAAFAVGVVCGWAGAAWALRWAP